MSRIGRASEHTMASRMIVSSSLHPDTLAIGSRRADNGAHEQTLE
jgi:hypothetical protein